jgi:ABC-type Mn2+/Zn2+ transport system permease subunit
MQSLELIQQHVTFQYALVVGLVVGLLCSLLSVFVVLKRMAFLGQGISHAGFGGVGTAMVLGLGAGWAQEVLVLLFCLGGALGLGRLTRGGRIEPDVAIGILLAGAMAWGVLMSNLAGVLRQQPWYQAWVGQPAEAVGFETLLFGSLLYVGPWDAVAAGVVALVVLGLLAGLFKEIVFFSFDEPAARVFGVPTGLVHYLLLGVLSLVIVVAIRLVGFVLVSALLVVPGAVALQLSRRLGPVLVLSAGTGLLGMLGGILLSLEVGHLSPGPSVVAVLCGLLGVALSVAHRGFRGGARKIR